MEVSTETIELRMPRNMVRFFKALAITIENEGSFDPYKDSTTREVIFNAPAFLQCDQAMLDEVLLFYMAHFGFHLTTSNFSYDGLTSDIAYRSIEIYPRELVFITKLINFLDFYDAQLLLRGLIKRVRSLLLSMHPDSSNPNLAFKPSSVIEKVYIKEARYRDYLGWVITQLVRNLDLFPQLTYNLWPQLGPIIECKGDFTIVATTEGLFGFGDNECGVLGLGDLLFAKTPTKIPLDNVFSFACNKKYSVFLTRDGLFECGLPVMRERSPSNQEAIRKPTKILTEIGPIVSVACGEKHMLLLTQDGTLYGHGFNNRGQLGLVVNMINDRIGSYIPIPGVRDVISFACGDYHTMILTNDGLFGCGFNGNGQLGLGDNNDRHQMTRIPIEGVLSVWCGPYETMILTKDGLFACGNNEYGQLGLPRNEGGDNDMVSILTRVPLENVLSIAFNGDATFILTKDGLYGCGAGEYFFNEVSDGHIFGPIRLPVENVIAVACGEDHCVILTPDGLYVDGNNYQYGGGGGVLGLGHNKPIQCLTKLTTLRVGIESSDLAKELVSKRKNDEKEKEEELETKKRRLGSLLCTRCDKIATHVEPYQERYRFCSNACYRDFFTPNSDLTINRI